jgi:hypothetical protein
LGTKHARRVGRRCLETSRFSSSQSNGKSHLVYHWGCLLKQQKGTWEYLSIYRLRVVLEQAPKFEVDPHLPDDDLESILWLVVWVSMKHISINIDDRWGHLDNLFRSFRTDLQGRAIGGDAKSSFLLSGGKLGEVAIEVEGNLPYTTLIKRLVALFTPRYQDQATYHQSRVAGTQVLAIFEECLQMDGWPTEDDGPKTFPRPSAQPQPTPYQPPPAPKLDKYAFSPTKGLEF